MTTLVWSTIALARATATILALTCLYLHEKLLSIDAREVAIQVQLDGLTEDHYDLQQEFYDYVTGSLDDGEDHKDYDDWGYLDPFADPDDEEPAPPVQVMTVDPSPKAGRAKSLVELGADRRRAGALQSLTFSGAAGAGRPRRRPAGDPGPSGRDRRARRPRRGGIRESVGRWAR